jgi:alpha/beta superfamily hydrolase
VPEVPPQTVSIASANILLEGCFEGRPSVRGAVVTHPHPLYGGDMHNTVVTTIARAYRRAGYCTLRFNFRGVGRSQGRYDEGGDEQSDVMAALDWMRSRGCSEIVLAGYSFGAWVNAVTASRHAIRKRLVMVSPPVAFLSFADVSRLPALENIITGGRDDFAPPVMIRELLSGWNPSAPLIVIEGADHFYSRHLEQLAQQLPVGEETL